VNPLAVFKTAAFNHSATLPVLEINHLADRGLAAKCELPPDCHREPRKLFSFRAGECGFHDLGGSIVRPEQVAVNG